MRFKAVVLGGVSTISMMVVWLTRLLRSCSVLPSLSSLFEQRLLYLGMFYVKVLKADKLMLEFVLC